MDSKMLNILKRKKTKRDFGFVLDRLTDNRLGLLSKTHSRDRGHKMAVFANDHIGGAINVFGIYEKEELEVLFDFLSPLSDIFETGVAFDIGANIGNHSLYFSKRFKAVHSFEPNPSAYYLLKFNVSCLKNVTLHNIGLGSERAVLKLVEDPTNMGGSAIKTGKIEEEFVDVSVEKLDDFEIDKRDLCFIKMDVEGFESKVINGGIKTISEFSPLIVLEQNEIEFLDGRTESISLLKDIGYKFCWHQNGVDSDSTFVRRIYNIKELFFGRTHSVVSGETVPVGTYSMLIAVPPRFQKILGV